MLRAVTRASWSTRPPLEMLMRKAVDFMFPRNSALTMFSVSWVRLAATTRMSDTTASLARLTRHTWGSCLKLS